MALRQSLALLAAADQAELRASYDGLNRGRGAAAVLIQGRNHVVDQRRIRKGDRAAKGITECSFQEDRQET